MGGTGRTVTGRKGIDVDDVHAFKTTVRTASRRVPCPAAEPSNGSG